jgi:hypothetical protein
MHVHFVKNNNNSNNNNHNNNNNYYYDDNSRDLKIVHKMDLTLNRQERQSFVILNEGKQHRFELINNYRSPREFDHLSMYFLIPLL